MPKKPTAEKVAYLRGKADARESIAVRIEALRDQASAGAAELEQVQDS